jgi:hypothetical protein
MEGFFFSCFCYVPVGELWIIHVRMNEGVTRNLDLLVWVELCHSVTTCESFTDGQEEPIGRCKDICHHRNSGVVH